VAQAYQHRGQHVAVRVRQTAALSKMRAVVQRDSGTIGHMAVIHRTTAKPTKLELLTAWLPTRPWYAGGDDLVKAGGFRLDDPEGEVGIEFMVVVSGQTCMAPLTYRGAPLDGAEHALVGTMEHGVLGRRWIYDACHDPVAVAQLLALIEGHAEPQDQNTSDTPDRDVTRAYTGGRLNPADFTEVTDDREGTVLGGRLRIHRTLHPGPAPADATGHVAASWQLPDGTRRRGPFVVLH
jgi:hypothetical protein